MKKSICILAAIVVWLCLPVLLGSGTNCLAATTVDPGEIEKVLRQLKNCPEQLRVSVLEKEVRISTFLTKNASDDDLKIDSVLMAKAVMEAQTTITRVIVAFFPQPSRGEYLEVIITLPTIVAFGGGHISKEELLSSLSVEHKQDETVRNQEKAEKQKEQDKKERLDKAREKQDAQVAEAKTKGVNPESTWATYKTNGISFQYPTLWIPTDENRGDRLVKLLSATKDSSIQVKLYKSRSAVPVLDEARHHVKGHMDRDGYTITAPSTVVRFGVKNSITGVDENITYREHGQQIYERCVYFGWPGYVFRIGYQCGRSDYQHMIAVFNKVLQTVRVESR